MYFSIRTKKENNMENKMEMTGKTILHLNISENKKI